MSNSNGGPILAPDTKKELLLSRIRSNANVDTVIFLDFETFYKTRANNGSKSFSLSGKTYYDYIFDERFHTTGLGFAEDNDEWDYIHDPQEIADLINEWKVRQQSGERLAIVAHNTQFDASILGWKYGLFFDYYLCTQLMAKYVEPTSSSSLSNTAKRLWPDDDSMRKGTELVSFDGIMYKDFTKQDHLHMQEYCIQDNYLMREMFYKFMQNQIPIDEQSAMHITLRGCVEPQFQVDTPLLQEVVIEEEASKAKAVAEAIQYCHDHMVIEVAPISFSSNPKYKALLERFCVDVPTKMSPTTFKIAPALGKNDPEYIKMQIDHPHLALLFKARNAVKSTIALTRSKKMIEVAEVFTKECGNGEPLAPVMPMFLNYFGALNTGRWSGGQKLNQQNLPRGGKQRRSLKAQDGFVIAVSDLSNIELRVNLWFCEQEDLLAKYEADPNFDMYSDLASEIFGYKVNKHEHKDQRQMGKAATLGLGYAMSWYGFQQYLASGPLGMDPILVSDEFAKGVKQSYVSRHYMVSTMWNELQNYVLPVLEGGGNYRFGRGKCCMAMKGEIHLPSGRVLRYPNTSSKLVEKPWGMARQFSCDGARRDRFGVPARRSLHKGLIIENIIQAIARDVLNWQMVNIEKDLKDRKMGWVIGSVHDEVLAMAKETKAQEAFNRMQFNMKQKPQWAAAMPLTSEGGFATEYSK